MKKILKKMPMLLYAFSVIIIAIFLTHKLEQYLISIAWVTQNEGEARVALYSSVLTIIGILYGVIQLQSQRKDSLLANEYINQPEFKFLKFDSSNELSENGFPGCCCIRGQICTNNCNDEHWFNLLQIGNLPATKIKISMFHEKEAKNVRDNRRIMKIETLNKGGKFQYKLPPFTYDETFLDQNSNGKFYVLLSYYSLYSNIRYKRVYELEYSPNENPLITDGLWENNITFYNVNLIKITDFNSISNLDLVLGSIINLLAKLKIKESYTYENWVLKY